MEAEASFAAANDDAFRRSEAPSHEKDAKAINEAPEAAFDSPAIDGTTVESVEVMRGHTPPSEVRHEVVHATTNQEVAPEDAARWPLPTSLRSDAKVSQPDSNLEGRKVRKHFEGFGWYQGTVMRHWHSDEYGDQFHVVYTDGDAEDLPRDVLLKHLLPVTPQLSSKETSSNQDTPRVPTPTHVQDRRTPSPHHGVLQPLSTGHLQPFRQRVDEPDDARAKFPRLEQRQFSPHHRLSPQPDAFPFPADRATAQLQRIPSLSALPLRAEANGWRSPHVASPYQRSEPEPAEEDPRYRFSAPLPSVAPHRTSFLSPAPPTPPTFGYSDPPRAYGYVKTEPLPRLAPAAHLAPRQTPGDANLVKAAPMVALAADQSALGRLNYHFLKAIKDTTEHYKFGEAFTCVLRDDPGYANGMDVTRLMQYCHLRRYPRISFFLNDVVKMRNTVSSTYPQDFAFRQQAGEYIDVLTRCIQELSPVLRQIEAIIIGDEEQAGDAQFQPPPAYGHHH
ncbi:hypothetical protein ACHHYP_10794 [Achlya hypogyna]|uniref:PTM/DIR17-like Tudor domain-containing protein n=1 Tax=Achlya hypogyna TaxID=1202772 RepID=A0A1V9YKM9_ACHHY|nr:hypothetical protein ACHHYP_10794 [Achlya hypogyna]